MRGQAVVWVDPTVLVERMGLKVKSQRIRSDSSVFGQIYFDDTDTEMYDAKADEDASIHDEAKNDCSRSADVSSSQSWFDKQYNHP